MFQAETPRRSALALTVAWQLMNEPMHVYRLQRHGLVEASQTTRVEGYPDRLSTRSPTPAARSPASGCARCSAAPRASTPSSSNDHKEAEDS